MANPYTRQSSFSDGDTINSSLFNNEYNALVLSFSATVGHTHDGSTGEGSPVTKIGPAQDVVIASTTILPKTNNVVDLGSSSLKFKDAYFSGNVNVDGAVTHSGNMVIGDAATDTLTINATIQGSSLVFEGATANAHELTLAIPDVSSDVTVTFPNATDTLVGRATTDTLTNKTLGATAFTGAITTTSTVDGVDIATRDGILTSTTTTAGAALPKAGGAMTGAITTNSTFDGRDVAADGVTADAALPKAGGAMTGAITTNSTFDGVDIATRDGILTSTTTTAGAALPKAGGAMTGAITTNSTFDGRDVATDGTKLDGIEASADVTDATNVTAAGALMDSELAGIDAVKATTGTFLTADQTKLDAIEASADVTDSTNVVAALTAGTGITISGGGTIAAGPIALTTVQTAANQTAHLALTAEAGDIVVRSDENKTYCHNGGTAGTMGDYTLLATPTDAVLSVNGVTGAITAAHIATAVEAASGSNTFTDADHSKLNAIEASATADQTAAQIKTHLEDGIDSVHYVDGSIDLVHMSANSVDSAQYVDGSIDLAHMSPNSVDSDQYVDGSIDTAHIAGDQITSALIADDQIDSEHYVDGSIDTVHIAASNITNALMADDAIGLAELSATGTASGTTFLRGDNTWGVPIGGVTSVNSVTGAITAANIATAVEAASDSNTFTDADHSKLNAITASANLYVHPNHSGDVVSAADGAMTIQTDAVDIAMLSATGTAGNSTFLRGDNTWATAGSTSASDLTSGTLPIARIADGAITGAKIAAGTVVASDVADDAITTAKILDANVTVAKMAANSVDSAQYVDGSIDLAHMSVNSIDSDQYVDGSIDTAHIAASNITNALMADDSVDSVEIVAGAIDLAHMSANSVDSPQYVDGSIDTIHISGNSITNDKMADDAVDEANLKVSNAPTDGYILTAEAANTGGMTWAAASTASIGDDSVTYSKIQNVSATDRILGRDSAGAGIIEEITPANLRTMLGVETGATADQSASEIKTLLENGIDSVHYVDGSIDLAHMSANSIDSTQYVDGSIDTAHYAGGSVDTTALADDAVTAAKIGDNVLDSEHYAAGSIDNEHLADDAVDSDEIAAGAIDLAHMSVNSIDSDQYVDGSIDTAHYAAGSVDTTALGADSVTTAKIADNVTLGGNVTVSGDLTISGDTTTVNTATLAVEDPLISLATGNNGADAVDIGMYGLYDTSGSQDLYGGLFRDASDSGKWKLFKDNQAAPTTTVNVSGAGYATGTLVSNIEGNVTGNVTGNTSGTAATVTGGTQASITSAANLVTVGTIGTGVWQGTAVASGYIAADAITGAKIADNAIDSEHYTDGSIDTAHIGADQVTYAKIQNVSATDRILGRDSASAGVIEEITPASLRTMINVADGANNYTLPTATSSTYGGIRVALSGTHLTITA